ncbi:MAG: PAS domain S-box protein, partial [Calditrichaeota bacterium]|nr:PAS domain S-box protein [Calditrichota bacterium]
MEEKTIQILLIEDDPDDAKLLGDALSEAHLHFVLIHVPTLTEGLSRLSSHPIDVILLDLNLPDSQGLDTMKKLLKHSSCIPVIVISILEDQETAVEAVKMGAQDYLVKSVINGSIMERVVIYAIERQLLQEALKKKEQFARTILEKNGDGILLVDAKGKILFANPAAATLFGVPIDELTGKSFEFPLTSELRTDITLTTPAGKPLFADLNEVPVDWEGKTAYLISIRDITQRKQFEQNLKRKDAILETLGLIAQQFLRASSWEEHINEVLRQLGEVTGVSRTYLFKKHERANGVPLVSQKYEWVAEGIVPQIDNPDLQNIPLIESGFGRWVKRLSKGKIIQGHIHDFPQEEQEILNAQDIKSILVVPIFSDDEWWGFIGFDNCVEKREWSFMEIEALQIAADILGAAIQRQKTEKKLRASELRYRTLAEAAQDAIYIIDLNGKVTYINRFAAAQFGCTPEELLGKHLDELFPKASVLRQKQFIKRIINREKIYYIEHKEVFRNQTRWFGTRLVPIKNDEGGKASTVMGISREITETRKNEEILKEQEATLRSFFESVPFMTGIVELVDDDVLSVTANKQTARFFKTSVEALENRLFSEIIAPKTTREMWINNFKKAEQTGRPVAFEYLYDDGEKSHWLSATVAPILHNTKGKPRFCYIIADITDRRRMEQELVETNKQLSRLLESSSAVIYTCKAYGNYEPTFISENVKNILGYESKDFLEHPKLWEEILHPEDKDRIFNEIKNAFNSGKVVLEYRLKHKDETYRWIYDEIQIMYNKEGQPQEIIGIWVDVTERKILEQQYFRAQRMESLGTLAGGIAHDLNNILTPILMATEILRQKISDEKGRKTLQMIIASARRGADLIKQVLSFARGTGSERSVVQIRDVIDEVIKIANEIFPKSISLQTNISENLWLVLADATQLHQILMNLIVNARDAMPAGGTI